MEHIDKMTEIFEEYYDWDKRRLPFLANMLSAIIRSRSVNMQKVAESIEGKAKTSSNYRRIQRVFQKQQFDYEMTARLLSTILPNKQWILTLDRTQWKLGKSNINILVLAVAHKGMAIPLLWKYLSKEDERGKQGNSDYKERIELMERFIKIFGVEQIKALVADREFIGKEWFGWLIKEDIPFIIRIRNNSLLEKELGDRTVQELLSHTEPDTFYAFGKTKLFEHKLYIGGIRSFGSKDALVLISNRVMSKESLETYRKRWEIETMFGALKTKGFNFEESKITQKEKVEKLMALLSLSFMWAIAAGIFRSKNESIAVKKKWQELSNQESFQTWFRMAKECISQYKAQKKRVSYASKVA